MMIFMWFLIAIGSLALSAGVFWLILNNYEKLEMGVLQKVSNDAAQIYDLLDRMFLRRSMNHCYLYILLPTGIMALVGFVAGLQMGLLNGVFAAGVLGLLGYRLPILAVKTMFSRRLVKFDRQLVDALDLMANAIKSGLSFMQVVQVIEREMPSPVSEEFGMVLKENRVGINLSDALLNMTKRVPSEDLFMIINSVVTLSQQGGDLSEAFDTIAKTIRERQRVLEKIRTLAQAGVTQGFILSAMPIAMLGMQWIIQPHYVRLLFVTPLGLAMLGGMVVMITFGALWMKKILTIEV
jgi:tight adherence protein B